MEPKPIYKSSTVWLNVLGVAVILLQVLTDTKLIVDADYQAIILAVINIINRLRTIAPIK